MKLMHLSDLHLGKIVNGFSMLEDQKYILEQIIDLAAEEKPDGVLIAGDVYDKRVPAAEAVGVLDGFLTRLAELSPVFVISGNHDSAERLAFGGQLMTAAGVYLSPVYDGAVRSVELRDEVTLGKTYVDFAAAEANALVLLKLDRPGFLAAAKAALLSY